MTRTLQRNTTRRPAAASAPGLRERKKQQTRLAISDIATRLFIERGFDRVTVAEVAKAADVSVNTIFNYFSTKEELFFDRAEQVEEEPSRIVRERRPGESALDALRRVYLQAMQEQSGLFRARRVKPFVAAIDASPALKLHERLLYDQGEQRLVRTLIAETHADPDDPTARVAAALIAGVQWMLIQELRTRLLRGESEAKIRAALLRSFTRAFDLLGESLGDYCRRSR
jgi:AcrR family transcriptional regulator